jgi:serine/threonine protein kinase
VVALRLAAEAALGVHVMHTHLKRVHLDLKPANIGLAVGDRVKLMDLGSSQSLIGGECEPLLDYGRDSGAAPEQVDFPKPRAYFATDVYRLGTILLQLACKCPLADILQVGVSGKGLGGA